MNKINVDLSDIDVTAKFEMDEMAIRGGQAERYAPPSSEEIAQTPVIEKSEELVERVRAEQQIDIHGMVKRYFQTISLPALWAVATDHYIQKQTKHLARKRIGRNYKRKVYASQPEPFA